MGDVNRFENVTHTKAGKFAKGNKLGGRKPMPDDIKMALNELVPEAITKLKDIIKTSKDDRILLDAVKVVFDRVYGKPQQAIDIDAVTDNTVRIVLEGELKDWAQ